MTAATHIATRTKMRRPTSRAMQRAFSGSFKLLQSHWNSIPTLVVGESEENNCYKLLQCHALFRFFDDVDPPFPINPLMRGRDRDPVARGPDLIKSGLQRMVFSLDAMRHPGRTPPGGRPDLIKSALQRRVFSLELCP